MAARAQGRRSRERGSALVEGAIIIPSLVLLLYWSAAMTDVMVLKIKGQEAARFAIWEMTVFRNPAQISGDIRTRFADLRSPASENKPYTGLMLYPQASQMLWSAHVDPRAARVGLGGTVRLPPTDSWILNLINKVISFLSRSVDAAVSREQFNVYGYAEGWATLDRASHFGSAILNGGDLPGLKGGNDLDHPGSMANFTFRTPLPSERPMRLIYDTWKAWPKPAAYTTDGAPTNTSVSPMQTYPTVEQQVSAQVEKITFFGLTRQSWFNRFRSAINRLTSSGAVRSMMGGQLPDMFSSARMDDPNQPDVGPLTILPIEKPAESWAPGRTAPGTNRLGNQFSSSTTPFVADDASELTGSVDRSRYTVPYQINSGYWTADGGATKDTLSGRTSPLKPQLAKQNEYVKSFACRGHYFAGATEPQQVDWTKRYKPTCANR